MNILKIIAGTAATALFMIAAAGCCKNNLDEPESADRRVLLFYECAFNDIGSYMRRNMEDQQKGLPAGHIPGKYRDVLHTSRSEERRVGKECRSRWSTYH